MLAWGAYFVLFVTGSDIYFIGGFGTVAWVDVKEYETLRPDKIAVDGGEQNLKVSFKFVLRKLLSWNWFWGINFCTPFPRCVCMYVRVIVPRKYATANIYSKQLT